MSSRHLGAHGSPGGSAPFELEPSFHRNGHVGPDESIKQIDAEIDSRGDAGRNEVTIVHDTGLDGVRTGGVEHVHAQVWVTAKRCSMSPAMASSSEPPHTVATTTVGSADTVAR